MKCVVLPFLRSPLAFVGLSTPCAAQSETAAAAPNRLRCEAGDDARASRTAASGARGGHTDSGQRLLAAPFGFGDTGA